MFILFCTFLLLTSNVTADQGVGVGTGKIQVEEELKPGILYDLPDLVVLNTGDEASFYKVGLTYKTDQEEMQIPHNWIKFSESEFTLDSGQTKSVKMQVGVPLRAKPGKYFSYVSATVKAQTNEGETGVGIAAASKLYLTVAPANIFEGTYYRVASVWKENLPWTNIIAGTVVIFSIIKMAGRFIHIQVKLDTKKAKKLTEDNE